MLIPKIYNYDELNYKFPKLCTSGGFELLRVPDGGKRLDIIAAPETGYNIEYLRAVVHHAKFYIRPLQNDLSLNPINLKTVSELNRLVYYCCIVLFIKFLKKQFAIRDETGIKSTETRWVTVGFMRHTCTLNISCLNQRGR